MSYLLSILFNKLHGKKKLSDIEYLAIKEFGGKLRQNDGLVNGTTGDVCTLTANTGKDMYLAWAQANIRLDTLASNPSAFLTIVLKINGVIFDTWEPLLAADSGGITANSKVYKFPFGFKVAAGQIIKIEITTADADAEIAASIVCFEEDTGVSPAI